jgi:phosphatidylserine decarboxylase
MLIYDRSRQDYYEEKLFGEKKLEFLYGRFGTPLLKFATSRAAAEIMALGDRRKASAAKIDAFCETYGIVKEDYEEREYSSFADFFTRKIKESKREYSLKPREFPAPADSKLLALPITAGLRFTVKAQDYELGTLLGNDDLARHYREGLCLIYRLSVDDYHRYIYSDTGTTLCRHRLGGILHSVTRAGVRPVLTENKREYTVLKTENFGCLLQMEVGAMLVGCIHNHNCPSFARGEEKGWFALGGSTIIQLLERDTLAVAADIREQSRLGRETRVRQGETIGERPW